MTRQKNEFPEIWGGIECTINRVDDRYLDQLDLAGLYTNAEYLDSIVSLGLKQIRFPVLWEKHQPALSTPIDWSFTEDCLYKLRLNNVEPVVGLLHHGSGPAFTDLLQENFPVLFAEYATTVAEKFPWVQYYTPVNEPLTTARFSGLYGLWYPHKKNDVSFIKMLLNELKATVLAMQAIRKINPSAKFIQTEDLGKTYSTPLLAYQANFENHRRWLTFDILCGKLDTSHPLWNYFMRLGIEKEKLQFFINNPCPPDLIGVNHYITSERYLDENTEHYPIESIGGNTLHAYADVEAVRVHIEGPHGLEHLLNEIWDRYNIPVAITETHLNCTREHQLRWFHHVYEVVCKLKGEGMDIRAVTAWALLGSFGWNKLLTCINGEYETGVFDISAGYARPTALSNLIKNIVEGNNAVKPLLAQHGWWKQPSRYYKTRIHADEIKNPFTEQPIVIIGKTGTLGQALSKICTERNIHHFLLDRSAANICEEELLVNMISHYQPWAIINAAGYVKVDEAESNKAACYNSNFLGVEKLAAVCSCYDIKLMTFSSDLVFGGEKTDPYVETDLPNPVNTYGHSKLLAERSALEQDSTALLIRTAAFFGPWDKYNFAQQMLSRLEAGKQFFAPDDNMVSPTYLPHLVNASLDLLIDDASGIWHLANKGCVTWYGFAKRLAERTNLNQELIVPVYNRQTQAKRPAFSALDSIKYKLMPSLDEALDCYFLSVRVSKEALLTQKCE